jgi:hypothetical protein
MRQIPGVFSQIEKTRPVKKLTARDRKRQVADKCEGRKADAEIQPTAVLMATCLHRASPLTGRRRSLRKDLRARRRRLSMSGAGRTMPGDPTHGSTGSGQSRGWRDRPHRGAREVRVEVDAATVWHRGPSPTWECWASARLEIRKARGGARIGVGWRQVKRGKSRLRKSSRSYWKQSCFGCWNLSWRTTTAVVWSNRPAHFC